MPEEKGIQRKMTRALKKQLGSELGRIEQTLKEVRARIHDMQKKCKHPEKIRFGIGGRLWECLDCGNRGIIDSKTKGIRR